jgi:hypothetical protein
MAKKHRKTQGRTLREIRESLNDTIDGLNELEERVSALEPEPEPEPTDPPQDPPPDPPSNPETPGA